MNSKLTLERQRPRQYKSLVYSRRLIQHKCDFTGNGPTGYKERDRLHREEAEASEYYTTISVCTWRLTKCR